VIRLSRFGIVHGALVLFAVALLLRAAHVQIWQGGEWEARAKRQHFAQANVPAPRGDILDASGTALVESRARVKINLAPGELRPKDRKAVTATLTRLGVPAATRRRAIDRRLKWVPIPGRYLAVDIEQIARIRGVYAEPAMERVTSASRGTLSLIGRVDASGVATDGLERALDHLLRGEQGEAQLARDVTGNTFASPSASKLEARPGNTIVLTIDRRLQDIAERALESAVQRLEARGGDIVVLDPNSGEIRALASYQADGRFTSSTPLTEPFEPGSTIKPILASRLIGRGLASPDEVIETYSGTYEINGRTITDDHPAPRLALRDVIALSSNIGIVRFAERLTPAEEFETLRDFGFGMPSGLPYPSEAAGRLYSPKQWSKMSAASMAMGYEMSVTSVQLAAAYASIANGGELLEPALVKEIRSSEGSTVFRHERRVVRRVMEPKVAAQVREMLVGVVESGTAKDAITTAGTLAGKTGTARLTLAGRGYTAREHLASFVGMFPAEKPQLVILVKLVNPNGSYGGRTAAPVSKEVVEAAVAARSIALGRREPPVTNMFAANDVELEPAEPVVEKAANGDVGSAAYVIALDSPSVAVPARVDARPVPDVSGLPMRGAVFALHRAGFRVRLAGAGRGTSPAAGTLRKPGTMVDLFSNP
jgi:cell division protein FtsI (penicillin-binding protein 3)